MGDELLKRIDVDADVMMGKPVTKGTRITVVQVLRKLAGDIAIDRILRDWPRLTEDDVSAAVLYAAELDHIPHGIDTSPLP